MVFISSKNRQMIWMALQNVFRKNVAKERLKMINIYNSVKEDPTAIHKYDQNF